MVCGAVSVPCENYITKANANNLSEDFKEIFKTKKFSDFGLMVNVKAIQVHRRLDLLLQQNSSIQNETWKSMAFPLK